ncbi:MAG: hypothetical protein AAB276_01330 [Pseudomonadota bacterium]
MLNYRFFGIVFLLCLSGCAGNETYVPRAVVLEAQSCMKAINKAPPNYPNYIIRECTNNGVWIVEQRDPTSNLMLESYDFLNQEYIGPLSGGQSVLFGALSAAQQQDILVLRKELNKDLLAEKKKNPEKKQEFSLFSLF